MDIVKTVAKARFIFYANMADVYNVANQLGILKDEKAEELQKKNVFGVIDCLERLGYDMSHLYDEKK